MPLAQSTTFQIHPITPGLKLNHFSGVDEERFISYLRSGPRDYSRRVIAAKEIPADHLHNGFFKYIEECWGAHAGVVLNPDLIWQVLMTEFSGRTVKKPELYRDLYTTSDEKQELVVLGVVEEAGRFALDIVREIVANAPTDVTYLTPHFTTTTRLSMIASSISLMETCSPYYDYGMYCCGLPAVIVEGEDADWALLRASWTQAAEVMSRDSENAKWLGRCSEVLDIIDRGRGGEDVWGDMFACEHCGSGSDVEVTGWLRKISFDGDGKYTLLKNLSTGTGVANFHDYNSKADYELHGGVFGSSLHEVNDITFAVPTFGWVATRLETTEEAETREAEEKAQRVERAARRAAEREARGEADGLRPDPKTLRLGWVIHEEIGACVINDESVKHLAINEGNGEPEGQWDSALDLTTLEQPKFTPIVIETEETIELLQALPRRFYVADRVKEDKDKAYRRARFQRRDDNQESKAA